VGWKPYFDAPTHQICRPHDDLAKHPLLRVYILQDPQIPVCTLYASTSLHSLILLLETYRISTPRRFGKTISVCLFVAALICACPNIEISIYSTCKFHSPACCRQKNRCFSLRSASITRQCFWRRWGQTTRVHHWCQRVYRQTDQPETSTKHSQVHVHHRRRFENFADGIFKKELRRSRNARIRIQVRHKATELVSIKGIARTWSTLALLVVFRKFSGSVWSFYLYIFYMPFTTCEPFSEVFFTKPQIQQRLSALSLSLCLSLSLFLSITHTRTFLCHSLSLSLSPALSPLRKAMSQGHVARPCTFARACE